MSDQRIKQLLILWHVRSPIFETNPICDFLKQHRLFDRTIPIINHNCLRDEGVALRFDISYESTIRKFLDSIHDGPLRILRGFPHVLIRFDYGILHLSSGPSEEVTGLDVHGLNAGPYRLNSQQYGMITGTTPLLLCAIIRECAAMLCSAKATMEHFFDECRASECRGVHVNTRLDRALDVGLLLASRHYHAGFGSYAPIKPLALSAEEGTLPIYRKLFREFAAAVKYGDSGGDSHRLRYLHVSEDSDRLTRLAVEPDHTTQSPTGRNARTVLSRVAALDRSDLVARIPPLVKNSAGARIGGHESSVAPIDRVLRAIVQYGVDQVLTDDNPVNGQIEEPSVLVPFVTFGQYVTMDWREIDSFLALRHLVEKYVAQADFQQPWPIAVFGPPGSGKSTLVREVLSSIPQCRFDEDLVCNLSQVMSSDGLARHFHRVQNRALKGTIPIAFFDEFDCPRDGESVGWLRHFLMPLQDGLYVEGEEAFDVGKAIFVFAGGVAHSYESFCTQFLGLTDQKVPDFVSRLRGFVNVLDISTDDCCATAGAENAVDGAPDRMLQLRRAVILRNILRRRMRQIVDVNSGVVRIHDRIIDAFLNVRRYLHGVRSIEAIVQMSRVATNSQSFPPSALPHESQLRMHIDNVERFMQLVSGR
jgi:hypothetical protein